MCCDPVQSERSHPGSPVSTGTRLISRTQRTYDGRHGKDRVNSTGRGSDSCHRVDRAVVQPRQPNSIRPHPRWPSALIRSPLGDGNARANTVVHSGRHTQTSCGRARRLGVPDRVLGRSTAERIARIAGAQRRQESRYWKSGTRLVRGLTATSEAMSVPNPRFTGRSGKRWCL
jgi:hypothetical protein